VLRLREENEDLRMEICDVNEKCARL
jgi:hypothetical protein